MNKIKFKSIIGFQDHIFHTWLLMKRFSLEPLQNSEPVHDEPENDDSLQIFFKENFRQPMAMSTQPGKTDDDIKQKIFNLTNQAPINFGDCSTELGTAAVAVAVAVVRRNLCHAYSLPLKS
jgi:hypothetical protein